MMQTRRLRGGDPDKLGRARAIRLYPDVQPCEVCGKGGSGRGIIDRHHRDSDRLNNEPANIAFLCRKHHAAAHRLTDGRVGGGPRPRIATENRAAAVARSQEARRLVAEGMSAPAVAARMGVDPWTVHRWFRKYRA